MNAVEIEEAISALAERPFDAAEFPFAFLEAFGNKEATIKKLRAGASNKSDLGGVLQVNHIHLKVAEPGSVRATLDELRASDATQNKRNKVRFILSTDGDQFEAEDLETGEAVACAYADFPNHFGFFLTLAGITTVKQIRENSFDIRATGRLNKLYVELLKDNPEWGAAERRPEMNHFMARLIFCFFAENTGIFSEARLFTNTIEKMSARDSANTDYVIGEIFRGMNTKIADREVAKLPRWTFGFPYVNGGLFSGSTEVPRISKIARSYLLNIGNLDWKQINPDIFGSMIQAVADDEERGALGMHYTSVPNILKVLNPLFLDDLKEKLTEAGDNARKLLNLRNRMARIRVFDPACGSGNFLVIAYKEMRAIEAEINKRRGEVERRSDIPLTNFRGIELRDFPAEIARLALIIAEFQCDVLYRGPKLALLEFLPLDAQNWITCGNALRLDWLSICPPAGTGVKHLGDDLFSTPLDQAQIDFENEGGETYICGNPPYTGSKRSEEAEKADLVHVLSGALPKYKTLDLVAAWIWKSLLFLEKTPGTAAFVATKSICQGEQAAQFWLPFFRQGGTIRFAHRPFEWANLAARNAGVTCVIVGIARSSDHRGFIYDGDERKAVQQIGPYLLNMPRIAVERFHQATHDLGTMSFGDHPYYGGSLIVDADEAHNLKTSDAPESKYLLPIFGTTELTSGAPRYCFWIKDAEYDKASMIDKLAARFVEIEKIRRSKKSDAAATKLATTPYRFRDQATGRGSIVVFGRHSSVSRPYLPFDVFQAPVVVSDAAFFTLGLRLPMIAVYASRMHTQWIATVCGRIRGDYRYSNTLGWNTFPVPALTDKNKADLTRCAEDILLAREAHFPASIADLYDRGRGKTGSRSHAAR